MTYFDDSLFSPSLVLAGLAASAFSELALGGAVGGTVPLVLGGGSTEGLSPAAVLLFADGSPVEKAGSPRLFVSTLGTVVEGAGRRSNSSFDWFGSRELAVRFEELFAAFPLTSCEEGLAGARLETSSPAVRASVTVGVASPAPFVLETLAVEVVDSVTAAGGVAKEAVFSGALVV